MRPINIQKGQTEFQGNAISSNTIPNNTVPNSIPSSNSSGGFLNSTGLVLENQNIPVPSTESNNVPTINNVSDSNDTQPTAPAVDNSVPSLINVVDAPSASIPMPKVENNDSNNQGFEKSESVDNTNNLMKNILNSDSIADNSSEPSGSANLNPALAFINNSTPMGEVPEISDVKIDSNGMVSSGTDLTLDDKDEDDIDAKEDFDD